MNKPIKDVEAWLGCEHKDFRMVQHPDSDHLIECIQNSTKVIGEDPNSCIFQDNKVYYLTRSHDVKIVILILNGVELTNTNRVFVNKNDYERANLYPKSKDIIIPKRYQGFIDNFLDDVKYEKYGIKINRGLVITSGPGLGKTRILKYIQNKLGRHLTIMFNDDDLNPNRYNFLIASSDRDHIAELYDDVSPERFNEDHPHYNFLLAKFDGGENFVSRVFATNQSLSNMSKAFLRPGRINEVLEILPPELDERSLMFKDFPVDLADETEGFSYAELQFLKICLIDCEFAIDKAWEKYNNRIKYNKPSSLGFSPND